MKDTNVGFIGLGLIGGSIARAIRAAHPETTIQVYTRRKNPDLEQGVEEGIIDYLLYDIDDHFSHCDIVFLCAPVLNNISFLNRLKPLIKDSCIITDVGSVKGNIHKEARRLDLEKNFIGGHPMAGSEKTGFASSSADLLKDSYYLLTPTPVTTEENLDRLTTLLACTHSHCVVLDARYHDDVTAAISHVPHIIAAALVNLVRTSDDQKETMKTFAAGGFKDITRIASSSPDMWESICLSNQESIDHFLGTYIETLEEFRSHITEGDKNYIHSFFQKAGEYRNTIPDKSAN